MPPRISGRNSPSGQMRRPRPISAPCRARSCTATRPRGGSAADPRPAEMDHAADLRAGQTHGAEDLGPPAVRRREAQVFPDHGAPQIEPDPGLLRPADAHAPETDLAAHPGAEERHLPEHLGPETVDGLAEEVAADLGAAGVEVAADPDAAEVDVAAHLEPHHADGALDLRPRSLQGLAEDVARDMGDLQVEVAVDPEAVESDLPEPRLAEGERDLGAELRGVEAPRDLDLVEVVDGWAAGRRGRCGPARSFSWPSTRAAKRFRFCRNSQPERSTVWPKRASVRWTRPRKTVLVRISRWGTSAPSRSRSPSTTAPSSRTGRPSRIAAARSEAWRV